MRARAFLLLAVALSAVAYSRLPEVYFISDDFVNFVTIADRGAFHFIIAPFAGHMGAVRNIITWLLFATSGLDTGPYGWLALLTHLVNVALFFRIAHKFTASAELSALGAAMWGTCPLLSGALGWYSVYGHALAATMFLVVLDQIASLPEVRSPVTLRTALVWAGLLAIGTNAFGVGISVVYAFPVALAILFPNPRRERVLFAVFVALPIVVAVFYYGWKWLYARYYEPLPFAELIMQEEAFRAIAPPLLMLGHLFGVGISGLLCGYWFLPAGDPVTVWPLVIAYIVAVGWAGVDGDATLRRRVVALLVVAGAIYGLIALARANLYLMWGMKPDIAAVQVRYHYAATILLGLVLVLVLRHAQERLPRGGWARIALSCWVASSVLFFLTREWRLNEHGDCRAYVDASRREIDSAIDTRPVGADVFIANQLLPPYCTGIMGYDSIPGWAGLFVIEYSDDVVRGRRVHFIEPEDKRGMFADAKHHRLSKLFGSR